MPGPWMTWATRRRPASGPASLTIWKPTLVGFTASRALIRAASRRAARLGVVRALAPVVAECAVPRQPFTDLIQANRQDQVVSRYATFDDLVGYCELSANPVGRIVLHVFGAVTPDRLILSDRICTALQLAEHWQDVAEDLRAGRIYLPGEDLARFGVSEHDLAAPDRVAAGPGADGVRGTARAGTPRPGRPAGREFARRGPGCRGRLCGRRPGRPGGHRRRSARCAARDTEADAAAGWYGKC